MELSAGGCVAVSTELSSDTVAKKWEMDSLQCHVTEVEALGCNFCTSCPESSILSLCSFNWYLLYLFKCNEHEMTEFHQCVTCCTLVSEAQILWTLQDQLLIE